MTKNKKKEPFTGLRPAKGSKFDTILDSYIYAVARAGMTEDEFAIDDVWAALIPNHKNQVTDAIEKIFIELGKRSGLTVEELILLDTSEEIVLFEDIDGRVFVYYGEDAEEDWAQLCCDYNFSWATPGLLKKKGGESVLEDEIQHELSMERY